MKFPGYDAHIFMVPSEVCNFDCSYCNQHTNDLSLTHRIDTERFMERLDQSGKTFLVTVCGGEPFMISNFIEFCRELTKKHYLRVDTNLAFTNKCRQFVQTIDPQRVVEIVFSTHIEERENLKMSLMGLVNLVKEFQAKGFKMIGNYVAHPNVLGRMEHDIEFFASHGIKVLPNFFQGNYKGREYSFNKKTTAYSPEEIALVARLNPLAMIPFDSPYKKPCQAGTSAFFLDENYNVSPCSMMKRTVKLGDFYGDWGLFSKVIRCPEKACFCQYNKGMCASLPEMEESLRQTQQKAISTHGVASWPQTQLMMASVLPQSMYSKVRRGISKLSRLKWYKGRLVDPATWHRSCC